MYARPFTLLLLAAAATPGLWGDVTLRLHNTLKLGTVLPGPIADRTKAGMQSPLPESTVRYRKGGQEYLQSGPFACLMDYDKQTITLIDGEHKQFATASMKDYAGRLRAALPGVPEEYRWAADASKVELSSRKTGRTDQMQGVTVEETEFIASIGVPAPDANGVVHVQPVIRMTMQVWTAKSPDASKTAPVAELTAHRWPSPGFSEAIDPASVLATIFGGMPGLGSGLRQMLEEVEKDGAVVLKAHLEAQMPGMADALRRVRTEQGQPLRGVDPDAPFAVMDTEVEAISGASVDDQVFVLPKDYHAAPFEDVLKAITPAVPKS